MIDAEMLVCGDCGLVHMEGGPGPADVDVCSSCDGRLADVELDDLVNVDDLIGL